VLPLSFKSMVLPSRFSQPQ